MPLRLRPLVLAALGACLAANPAVAHPHVFVTARAEIVFDADGRMQSVRNIWQFDEAFSAYAVQGLDTDEDGAYSPEELAPLAEINIESLNEYGFFTWLRVDSEDRPFVAPTEYWLDIYESRLTLFFTLPLAEPEPVGASTTLEIGDPEYFVAFEFPESGQVTLVDAPAGCSAAYHAPQELDEQTMTLLAAIPADQRELPPELEAAVTALSSHVTVACQ
jgi:ABC-type uncharacterized transport system substrate-binding protein